MPEEVKSQGTFRMSFNTISIVIIVVLGIAGLIFISPLLGTLLELGDYTWLLVFGVVIPLAVAVILYALLRVIGRITGLARR